jgi:hypothetical protein
VILGTAKGLLRHQAESSRNSFPIRDPARDRSKEQTAGHQTSDQRINRVGFVDTALSRETLGRQGFFGLSYMIGVLGEDVPHTLPINRAEIAVVMHMDITAANRSPSRDC